MLCSTCRLPPQSLNSHAPGYSVTDYRPGVTDSSVLWVVAASARQARQAHAAAARSRSGSRSITWARAEEGRHSQEPGREDSQKDKDAERCSAAAGPLAGTGFFDGRAGSLSFLLVALEA